MKGVLLAAILLGGCGAAGTREEQAIRVAYGEARSRFGYAQDIRTRPPHVEDRGDRWRIEFRSPPLMVGGNPVIDVRKSDLSILLSVEGQ